MTIQDAPPDVLASATRKAYRRLLPILFLCYMIAYVDRTNVSLGKLTMTNEMPAFSDAVIGYGVAAFFVGYFLLEIPGSLIVERWSARKWICRIMLSWGVMAALTALVKTPTQFYWVRFGLGLAEAGFFPGVIVFLTHWFPIRDRGRALALFFVATPVAQIISPKISNLLLKIGTAGHPAILGMHGWQWLYIFWGLPAILLGILVWIMLPDHPRNAVWLSAEEKAALENELHADRARRSSIQRVGVLSAVCHPKVLLLTAAYFCTTSANYGFETFLPSILKDWYGLKLDAITWLVILPPLLALVSQLFAGWSSDRLRERRLHAVIPTLIGGVALALVPATRGQLAMTIACFMLLMAGIKALQPAFWALPNLLLTESAAAGSIGLINSVGNLGGALGPSVLGSVKTHFHSFVPGIYLECGLMFASAMIVGALGLGRREVFSDSVCK